MADDLSKRPPADATRINVNESWELSYWREKFHCSDDDLKAAVKAVGVMATDVAVQVKKMKKAA